MKVLSLFDGISCGMVALERAGIPVERYVAYEIDKNAIKISEKNYPQIERCGDVKTADFSQYQGFDLIMGGFPCQDLSIGQHKGKRTLEGKRSGLFWDLVRAINTVKPKFFLVENNFGMPEEAESIITETLGVEPIMIDSALMTAQRRKRLYWTNIPNVVQPDDAGIKFQDIIESGYVHTEKSYCLTANYNGAYPADLFKSVRSQVFEPNPNGKYVVENGVAHIPGYSRVPGKEYVNVKMVPDGVYDIRKMTVAECAKLQTMPVEYFEGCNENDSRKALGNGWTADVIAHIFSFLPIEYKKQTLSCFGNYDGSNNQCMRHCELWIECEKAENQKWIERKEENMEKGMEMNVQEFTLPEVIKFNYEELKAMIQERCDFYESAVYTEAEIKNAKADKAMLNKLKKALNDERIKREREYMQPFNDFKAKVNEIISIIDKPVLMIDSQVKAFEEKQKEAKKAEILAFYETLNAPEELNFELMFDSKWLNASANMKNVQEEVTFGVENFKANMDMLSKLPEFGFEAQQVYIRSLDLQTAISEANKLAEMARLKAEKDAEMARIAEENAKLQEEVAATVETPAEKVEEPERQWVYLQVNVSGTEMDDLRDFMSSRNIEFIEI